MMCNYLSDLSLPELPSQMLDRSDKYLHAALSSSSTALTIPSKASKAGFLVSSVGLATLILIRALGDPQLQSGSEPQLQKIIADAWPASAKVLNSVIQLAVASRHTTSDDGCELLYGRAGILYALLRIRSALDRKSSTTTAAANRPVVAALQPLVADSVLVELVGVITQRGKNGSAAYATELVSASRPAGMPTPPLMWSWLGKCYIGGAHGVGMYLFQLTFNGANGKLFSSRYTSNDSLVSSKLYHDTHFDHS